MPRKSKEERASYMREYRKRKSDQPITVATDRLQILQTIRAVIAEARRGVQPNDIMARYDLINDELKEILQLARDLRT